MPVLKFRFDDLMQNAGAPKPVPVPIGDAVSQVRSHAILPTDQPGSRFGVWECSPGRWRRQVVQAEFCHFLEGEALFTPDGGEAIRIRAGDVAYFPQNSAGVWDIIATSRKIFMIFDERTS